VLPQTSTIASHLPKALGTAIAIEQAKRIGHALPIPDDSIAICSFGDASSNHATAQTAFNAAAWTAYQKLPAPVLFVCEDNGIGISVKTPRGWIGPTSRTAATSTTSMPTASTWPHGYGHVAARGRALPQARVARPSCTCAPPASWATPAPTSRSSGARSRNCVRSRPPTRCCVGRHRAGSGLMSKDEPAGAVRRHAASAASPPPKTPIGARACRPLADVMAPLAPYSPDKVQAEAARADYADARLKVFGGEASCPRSSRRGTWRSRSTRPCTTCWPSTPRALLFGEDVAQKGGVYTVTKGLFKAFSGKRVFNTLLDETMILGLAQGYANMGMLPMPEIQYLAYFHNACDQIRGEAASLQFFSNGQYRNPMVMRIASLGYQRGFGGHFHNDNSITALRDIPGWWSAAPRAATMRR
jgi:2-oxoisovalerate dehydrogenase E1 component